MIRLACQVYEETGVDNWGYSVCQPKIVMGASLSKIVQHLGRLLEDGRHQNAMKKLPFIARQALFVTSKQ